MQIVIDIPDEKYQGISNIAEEILDESTFCSSRYLYKAVLNGTILPKGHGDLIDRNELLKTPMDIANYPSNYVMIAKAIIKADKTDE